MLILSLFKRSSQPYAPRQSVRSQGRHMATIPKLAAFRSNTPSTRVSGSFSPASLTHFYVQRPSFKGFPVRILPSYAVAHRIQSP